MTGSSYRRNTCRLCDGRDLDLVIPLAPTPVADDYVPAERLDEVQETCPLDLYLCRRCGHLQLLYVVDPELLFGNYLFETSTSLGLVEHYRRFADDVLDWLNPPPGALAVEIGSNEGSLLRCFQSRGMKALGVDPARDIARRATESGVETLPTFFTTELARQIKLDHGPATLIAANNVFAHADDLADMAEGVRELLAPDGVFVFEVAYLVDVIQKGSVDNFYHEHLSNHRVEPLQLFLKRHGLELTNIQRMDTKGGSLRGQASLANGHSKVSPQIASLIELETTLGLDGVGPYQEFAARIDGTKRDMRQLLLGLKQQGKTLAGYGASPSVTTLLYHFDIAGLISFLVDDNPLKHNLYSPGHHIPVFPSQAIYESKPDYVVILAWLYSGRIIENNRAYLDQGGHFIVPLPEVQVI